MQTFVLRLYNFLKCIFFNFLISPENRNLEP